MMRMIQTLLPAWRRKWLSWLRRAAPALLLTSHVAAPLDRAEAESADMARRLCETLARTPSLSVEELAARHGLAPGAAQDARSRVRLVELRDGSARWTLRYRLLGGVFGGMLAERLEPLREGGPAAPTRQVMLDRDCVPRQSRVIDYAADGMALAVRIEAEGRATVVEPLNPPAPPPPENAPENAPEIAKGNAQGNAHGVAVEAAVVVGLIDSGVDYTRPDILAHLRFTPDGALVGRDLWDGDDRPFDADLARSPFLPRRHGTLVADLYLRHAPDSVLLPVRYPRPDMRKMGQAVAFLAEQGARLVILPMGGGDPKEWRPFVAAAAAHPRMLFVISAGNDGRDIDLAPVYPAASGLANALVVTSVLADGALAEGSNWGVEHVDLGLPAEDLTARGVGGAAQRVAGSSFAAPLAAALAACEMARDPLADGATIRARVLALARTADGATGSGVILETPGCPRP